ncbi:CDP-alcohol phosphatidyltransferase family protein [Melioribacteraceae bacterium 4301-Me]|uniref:CDP-alcohol phosphatidyltransferase family protein n=1 Tax=Pyranulibacter aquaticus TaxID=3163344 RepID=UPI00359AEB23
MRPQLKIITVSNIISFIRLLIAFPLLFLFKDNNTFNSYRILIVFLLIIAFITDVMDGYLARKRGEVTEFGKIIDPVADKVLVFVIVFSLFLLHELPNYLFWVILLRDLLILIGGIIFSLKLKKVLPSNLIGKITVFIIGFLLMTIILGIDKELWVYKYLIYLSILFSIISVLAYLIRAIEAIKWSKNESDKITEFYKN